VSKIVPFIKSNTRHKTEKTVDETAEARAAGFSTVWSEMQQEAAY